MATIYSLKIYLHRRIVLDEPKKVAAERSIISAHYLEWVERHTQQEANEK